MFQKLFCIIDEKISVVLIAFLTCCIQAMPFMIIYALGFNEFGELPNSGCLSIGTVYWLLLFFASAALIIAIQNRSADALRPWLFAEPFAWMLMPIPLYLFCEQQFVQDKKSTFSDIFKLNNMVRILWASLFVVDCFFIYFYVFVWLLFQKYRKDSVMFA